LIKILFLDVDGVLTDGTITYDVFGREVKSFNVKDGYGIVRALKKGIEVVVLSGRYSSLVERRCCELGIEEVHQGICDKLSAAERILNKKGLSFEEAAFMGDDVQDLPLLKAVGVSGAPRDAVPEVKLLVDFVSKSPGGRGAVREFIDWIIGRNEE
jgi:3-deoxy-D-manno-octulosonate 8-phosphate phosphatase (KDO 8-P phosphatase)